MPPAVVTAIYTALLRALAHCRDLRRAYDLEALRSQGAEHHLGRSLGSVANTAAIGTAPLCVTATRLVTEGNCGGVRHRPQVSSVVIRPSRTQLHVLPARRAATGNPHERSDSQHGQQTRAAAGAHAYPTAEMEGTNLPTRAAVCDPHTHRTGSRGAVVKPRLPSTRRIVACRRGSPFLGERRAAYMTALGGLREQRDNAPRLGLILAQRP